MRSAGVGVWLAFTLAGSVSAETLTFEAAASKPATLEGPRSGRQLLVVGVGADGKPADRTRDVTYRVEPADVASVDAGGFLAPLRDGQATVVAERQGQRATLAIVVSAMSRPVDFAERIVPLLTRAGCNGGTCHGKTGGQNGFALSLFGFEGAEDYESLIKENRGRRIFPASLDASLLLTKASGQAPHAGGRRWAPDSDAYRTVLAWLAQGAPRGRLVDAVKIEVFPKQRTLTPGQSQQLAVVAHRADGTTYDATRLSRFEAVDPAMADVSADGLVTAKKTVGVAAVMVRYQTHADAFQALIPLGAPLPTLPAPRGTIDRLVFARWRELGLPPSPLADDATYLRRVTLDVAGRLPTLDEAAAFAKDVAGDRHEKLVDRLLASEDHAYYFAGKWGAVLRNRRKSDKDDAKPTVAFHAWIKDRLAQNKRYDEIVREFLTVAGAHPENPPVVWYREVRSVNEQVEDVAQLFLGQRIGCARCHHHPLEKWSQDDYWAMGAFFSRVDFKDPPAPKKTKEMKDNPPKPPMTVAHRPGRAEAKNPKSGKTLAPAPLGGAPLAIAPDDDPRAKLADWIVARENPYFARTLVNRYWKHFLGRALVEPEDDLRTSNPAVHPALLDAMAGDFVKSGYDLRKLVREICLSHPYRVASAANAHNGDDRQNFSRFQVRRLPAEVLLDAVDDVTGVRTNLKGGVRAVRLPDNQNDSYFLSIFGRPDFASACECERSGDSTLAQALHLANSLEMLGKISKGRAAKMAKESRPHAERIRDLYLAAFARTPRADELRTLTAYVERRPDAVAAYEDVCWAILNSTEFLFNH